MSEPTRCYAVTCGAYSDYRVLAIYRRPEDAERRVTGNNSAAIWLVDGEPFPDDEELPTRPRTSISGYVYEEIDGSRVQRNPAREEQDDLRVEELDYYEGEPTPGRVKIYGLVVNEDSDEGGEYAEIETRER
jgi:hypothetical protein